MHNCDRFNHQSIQSSPPTTPCTEAIISECQRSHPMEYYVGLAICSSLFLTSSSLSLDTHMFKTFRDVTV
ncbi:hypothetical protein E2C01_089345 [Portunus trituberculatus]|uniref:Uncharacterized protein n=1 Tax=Portunus trituberculatus TaxID=210409 RepID=A0A5B7JGY5_PORTR|nr:hypothetical protein [Portunus trituberculatus]